MLSSINLFQNFDLLSVGIAVAAIGILGFVVFINNRESVTARSFLFFSLVTIFWSIVNYASYQIYSPAVSFWILRLVMFFAVWHSFSFFQLAYVFPENEIKFAKFYKFLLFPFVALVSFLTLTSFVFQDIGEIAPDGRIMRIINGPGIAIFGILVFFMIWGGIALLLRKAYLAKGTEKNQLRIVIWGMFLTFALLLTFNFLLPAFAQNPRFIPFGPVFLLPFALFTFYATFKHNLLNVKVISTEIVAFFLVVVTFAEVVLSSSFTEIVFRLFIFAALLLISLLLIRSVIKEVKAREEIERLASDLETANEALKKLDKVKSEFISLAGHQLRAPLTAIKGYTSMLIEGSFGVIVESAHEALRRISKATEQLVKLTSELLDLSRIESGRFKYEFKKISLASVTENAIKELEENAKTKNLKIDFKNEAVHSEIYADSDKIHEVVINLIDNAIKYSNGTTVEINLKTSENAGGAKILLSVSDKGIGIKPEDIPKLFVKFGRSEEARKIRPDGMGLGLYFVKKIIEDHKGKVWVESGGLGSGSMFYVELPVAI